MTDLPEEAINIIGETSDIATAIDLLYPEFKIAEIYRYIPLELVHEGNTYFSTIPRDIVHIIMEFIGKIRQKYACSGNFAAAEQSLREFVKKYTINPDNLDSDNMNFNLSLLKRDYPADFAHVTSAQNAYIKNIAGKLTIILENNLVAIGYAGLSKDGVPITFQKTANANTIEPNIRKFNGQLPPPYSGRYELLYILPCGLIMINNGIYVPRANDGYREFLYNIDTNHAVELVKMSHWDIPTGVLIDDFGCKITETVQAAVNYWSDLTCEFLFCRLE